MTEMHQNLRRKGIHDLQHHCPHDDFGCEPVCKRRQGSREVSRRRSLR